MAERPLNGCRIVVTRAQHQSIELREKLEELGAEVISLPLIEIAPPDSYAALDNALRSISQYDWLVLTSANAVQAVRERLESLALSPNMLQHLHIAAVGSATAKAVTSLGLTVALTPEHYVAEELAAALTEQVRDRRVLIARAYVARDVIPESLREAGAQVDVVEAYQTVVPADSEQRVRELFAEQPSPDVMLFASSSAVKHFFTLLERAELQRPEALKAVSIGPVTSATLRLLGWEPLREASESTTAGLAQACLQLLSTNRS